MLRVSIDVSFGIFCYRFLIFVLQNEEKVLLLGRMPESTRSQGNYTPLLNNIFYLETLRNDAVGE